MQYAERHPTAADVLLLVAVPLSTTACDRTIKVPLYARHGIPEVWLLDLATGLLLFRAPHGGAYVEIVALQRPGRVAVAALAGAEVDFSDLT